MKNIWLIIYMKKIAFISIFGAIIFGGCTQPSTQQQGFIANPMNLNYRFQSDDPSRREAADPVCEYFKGKYYLFASKAGGYWSSPDLKEWTHIPCKTIETIEAYAPSILVYGDSLYYLASGENPKIFKTANPDIDKWEAVDTKFHYGHTDPAFYLDDDGRVYLYWGCSDREPIVGVEVDPKDGFRALGTPDTLIYHNNDKYGWEVPGANNEEQHRTGWNEAPCMTKHNGKYYLQYAAPGTEYRIYGDGVYVSDKPLGPYTYSEHSPFCFKPGGFIGGAGHGHTFLDKYGNYWHVATMVVSVRHKFERRLGLFPVYFSDDGNMYAHTVWTDYPFMIPDKKTNMEKNCGYSGWNLLSYRKPVEASSELSGFEKKRANDEQIETWWSAKTGNAGEWWQVDLGKVMVINAVHVNFADHDFTNKAGNSYVNYQYIIEGSDDLKKWKKVTDRSKNTKDEPNALIVLDKPEKYRYLRITNSKELAGKFSISDFRVFGNGGGELPKAVTGINVERNSDARRFQLSWDKQEGATGYIVRWGVDKTRLNNAAMVFDNQMEGGYFNRDSQYYFAVDVFNENGVTTGEHIVN